MELCTTTRCISPNLPKFTPFAPSRAHLPWKFSLPLAPNSISRKTPGRLYYNSSSIKSMFSEETSTGTNQSAKDERDSVVTVDEVQAGEKSDEKNVFNGFGGFQAGEKSDEKNVFNGFGGFGLGTDDSPTNDQFQPLDFLEKLNMELDFEDSFTVALLSGGGLTALWLTTAIVGAIDNIPVFPKLMEVVGLGYTVWFSSRYLLFKKNRDELAAKIEEIKQQVLGSNK